MVLLVALEVSVGAGLVGGIHSAEPFELTACRLVSPDRPGCGIKWDERAVRRFRLAT
jgi:hypothetical protein